MNIDITFSIDGVTKDVYEYIRKGSRIEDLLKSICRINEVKKKYGRIRTSINSVIMKSNYQQLELFVDFARTHKFDALTLVRIDENFDSQENIFYRKDLVAQQHIKNVLPNMTKKAKDYGIELINYIYPDNDMAATLNVNIDQNNVVSKDFVAQANSTAICYLPWRELVVDVIGVRPDCRCPVMAGTIFEMTLADIWNGQTMQLYRNKLLNHDQANFCRCECVQGVIPTKALKGITL